MQITSNKIADTNDVYLFVILWLPLINNQAFFPLRSCFIHIVEAIWGKNYYKNSKIVFRT